MADDQTINPPKSVTSLTCLNNFFNGVGLNLVTNLLDPSTLLQNVEGQICNAVQSRVEQPARRRAGRQTLTGFNLGFFGGLGGGSICPRLSFGGGGPKIGTIGISGNGSGGMCVNGSGLGPTGYKLPSTGGAW